MDDFYKMSVAEQARRQNALVTAALAEWDGEFSDLKLIKYRENAVYSAVRQNGTRVAVRVHRHGYHSDDALRSELRWMSALASAGIAVPESVPTRSGAESAIVAVEGMPEPRQVDVLTWLDGQPIGDVVTGIAGDPAGHAGLFHQLGSLAARIHDNFDRWEQPKGLTRHAWDYDGLLGQAPV